MLLGVLVMDEKEFRLHERAWEMVRILGVAKSLNVKTLDETSDLLFDYLTNNQDPAARTDMQDLRYLLVSERVRDEMGWYDRQTA
jgi:hypothetical protein